MYDVVYIGNSIESPTLESLRVEPEALMECRGEVGNFKLSFLNDRGEKDEIETGTIVVNIEPDRKNSFPGTLSFQDEVNPEEGVQPDYFIFIQDFAELSPAVISNLGLKKAVSLIEEQPETAVYYFYRSLRFSGENDRLFEEARRKGIVFLKYESGSLSISDDNKISYNREDISLTFDKNIVMAPVIRPAEILKKVSRILNIKMGPAGFLQEESVYLQPTLTGKRGVYVLGGSRGITAYTSFNEEVEFTLNEIESLLDDVQPLVEHNRVVDDQKCALCYTCYRVCQHGALQRDDELDAMVILNLACHGCDSCISQCPASAISIEGEKPSLNGGLKVMMCENSARTAWDRLQEKSGLSDIQVETIPCAGSVNKEDLYRDLRLNGGRILVLGCFEESCKHINGDQKASRVINEVNQQLAALGLGEDRVIFKQLAPRMEEDLASMLASWKEGN